MNKVIIFFLALILRLFLLIVDFLVRDHFQKAVEKSTEIFDSGEGDVSQADLTKLKLGLSRTLNNIIDLELF